MKFRKRPPFVQDKVVAYEKLKINLFAGLYHLWNLT